MATTQRSRASSSRTSTSRHGSTSRSTGRANGSAGRARSSNSAKPRTKAGKQDKVHKVMKEYKEGTLKSGPKGKGGKVKSRKQAVAIAMSESGQSRANKKKSDNKKSASTSKKKTASKRSTATKKATAPKSRSRTAARNTRLTDEARSQAARRQSSGKRASGILQGKDAAQNPRGKPSNPQRQGELRKKATEPRDRRNGVRADDYSLPRKTTRRPRGQGKMSHNLSYLANSGAQQAHRRVHPISRHH